MAEAKNSVLPVTALEHLGTSLQAGVLGCLAEPGKRAVHRVRTETRRIEAHLEFVSLLNLLPRHEREAAKLRKRLKKLRGAAGTVRDLDVQRDLIKRELAANAGDAALSKDGGRLRRKLKTRRDHEAKDLLKLLEREKRKLPRAFRALLNALEPAREMRLAERRVVLLVRDWYRKRAEPHSAGAQAGNSNELHAVRKLAKLARYLAEAVPEPADSARKLEAHFQSMQEAGGQWHDRLQLAKLAKHELGKRAALSARFRAEAAIALSDYQARLHYKM